MAVNMTVVYDEDLDKLSRALDDGMNAMHKHYVHNVKENTGMGTSRWLNFKLHWAYKFAYYFQRSIGRWMHKHAYRTVEMNGRVLEMDWSRMHMSEIAAEFEKVEEAERLAAEKAAADAVEAAKADSAMCAAL